jgi:nucleoside-diphosphate-sugar epimerase
LESLPFFFLLPGDGSTLLQPLWVEDLATCLTWALEDEGTRNQMYEIGGPEHLNFRQMVEILMQNMNSRRRIISIRPPYLRAITVFMENLIPALPFSVYWLDYLATNRTCALDTVPRFFNLMPSRYSQRLDYLKEQNWRRALYRNIWRRRV